MDAKQCRCPLRPYFGGLGSGSTQESEALNVWQQEHGHHVYAKARDELARALQAAEGVMGSGAAVLDMVADVFNQPRPSRAPTAAGEAVREASRRNARAAAEAYPGGEYFAGAGVGGTSDASPSGVATTNPSNDGA